MRRSYWQDEVNNIDGIIYQIIPPKRRLMDEIQKQFEKGSEPADDSDAGAWNGHYRAGG